MGEKGVRLGWLSMNLRYLNWITWNLSYMEEHESQLYLVVNYATRFGFD